jgi:hypothetical protein
MVMQGRDDAGFPSNNKRVAISADYAYSFCMCSTQYLITASISSLLFGLLSLCLLR